MSHWTKRLALAAAALALAACSPQPPKTPTLHLYNWSDYIDPKLLADFTKETGIKVVYDTFDSNEVLETKVLQGDIGYDLVAPSNHNVPRYITAGAIEPLDKTKLANLKNLWPEIMAHMEPFDPGAKYSVPYMWGTIGIGYNPDAVAKRLPGVDVASWDVVFKPENLAKLKDCGVYFLDSPTDVIPSALKYLGLDPDDNSPESLQKVEDMLMKVRPDVRKFHSSEYINALANGDICVAIGWSGDVFQARDRADEAKAGVHLAYAVPKEGAEMWFDQMAIPADAQHTEEALEFLNYMMKPEVIAKASNYVYYANGNKASQQFINKDILDDPAVYPDEETLKKLFTVGTLDPKTQRNVTRMWTKVVTGQ